MSGYKNDNTHAAKAGSLFIHLSDSNGCKQWGSFGYKTSYGQLWFCRAHKQEGEDALGDKGISSQAQWREVMSTP